MTRLALLLPLVLLACQGPADDNRTNEAQLQNQLDAPVKDIETLPPDETAVVATGNGTAAVAPASTKIPESLHGRWGMVPADCTSTRGDAKGLLTVGADTLTFYESRARLTDVASADPNRFSGAFAFTGEGQTWKANITLSREGDTLVREDEGSRFSYRRCA
jgi:hypothetical protein